MAGDGSYSAFVPLRFAPMSTMASKNGSSRLQALRPRYQRVADDLTKRRVGTEVVARTPRPSYGQPTDTIGDLLQYAEYGARIARIEQSIQAVRLGKRQAKLLRALDGGPALRAVRRYYEHTGRLIELSSTIHPGERFTYVTSLVRP